MCTFYSKGTEGCGCISTEKSTRHNIRQRESRLSLNVTPRYIGLHTYATFPLLSSSFYLANHTLKVLHTFTLILSRFTNKSLSMQNDIRCLCSHFREQVLLQCIHSLVLDGDSSKLAISFIFIISPLNSLPRFFSLYNPQLL